MIVVSYDGSEDAQAAADYAVRMFRGEPVTVLTVLESYMDLLVGAGYGLVYDQGEQVAAAEAQLREQAHQTADAGAQRLRAAGIEVRPLVEQRDGSIALTVLAAAQRMDADAIVVGTRGRGAARSTLLGSVSHELVQHADRAVVVVPSPALSHRRQSRLRHVS